MVKMFVRRKHINVRQPYGGLLINGLTGEVQTINDTAFIFAEAMINTYPEERVVEEVMSIYDVSEGEVREDFKKFRTNNTFNPHTWAINGCSNRLSLAEANIELTLRCPLHCDYCYANASPNYNISGELTTDEWIKTCNWLIRRGLRQVSVTGGDPLMSPSFWPVIEFLSKKNCGIRIFTTGIKVDNAFAERIKKIAVNFVEPILSDLFKKK
jgi:sulfatase maturation enzyme AslB (radical SAM superfamily)